jgi:alpha-L-fucosidase
MALDQLIPGRRYASRQAPPAAVRRFLRGQAGLSVHWGLYALLGRGEWVMNLEKIPRREYERLQARFHPAGFNAREWVGLAQEAGLGALLVTAKHHDGFCLFDTATTDYRITNTPWGRDPLQELAAECRRHRVALHVYYSILDWHHPHYRERSAAYIRYYQAQVRELCTNYGPLGGVLFDGYWPRSALIKSLEKGNPGPAFVAGAEFDLAGTYDLIHTLQPEALITNNHHIPPLPGEDYQLFEQDLPGENTMGGNITFLGDRPLVTWNTLNAGWSYNPRDQAYKTPAFLRAYRRRCAARGVYLFLNVGPTPAGRIPAVEADLLRALAPARPGRRAPRHSP